MYNMESLKCRVYSSFLRLAKVYSHSSVFHPFKCHGFKIFSLFFRGEKNKKNNDLINVLFVCVGDFFSTLFSY